MRKVALIQARMDSSRLPGKVLMPLAGKPTVLHVVERLRASRQLDQVVVATADHASSDPLVELCKENGVDVFRGSLPDVLLRLTEAGRAAHAEIVARVTCDCPLVEIGYLDKRLALLEKERLDFTYCRSSCLVFAGASVMSMAFLEQLNREVADARDREHCGLPYAQRHRDRFRSREVFPDPQLNAYNFRLTVDELADYELMSQIYEILYRPGVPIAIWDVIRLLEARPDLAAHNRHIKQNPLQAEPILRGQQFDREKN
jgi:spore coat polysaccharide biosynthesis protein SpsF